MPQYIAIETPREDLLVGRVLILYLGHYVNDAATVLKNHINLEIKYDLYTYMSICNSRQKNKYKAI